jgi:hypothetical protein
VVTFDVKDRLNMLSALPMRLYLPSINASWTMHIEIKSRFRGCKINRNVLPEDMLSC